MQVEGGEHTGLRGDAEDAAGGIKGEDVGVSPTGKWPAGCRLGMVSSTSWALPSQATYARLPAGSRIRLWSGSQPGTGARRVMRRLRGSMTAISLRVCTSTRMRSPAGS